MDLGDFFLRFWANLKRIPVLTWLLFLFYVVAIVHLAVTTYFFVLDFKYARDNYVNISFGFELGCNDYDLVPPAIICLYGLLNLVSCVMVMSIICLVTWFFVQPKNDNQSAADFLATQINYVSFAGTYFLVVDSFGMSLDNFYNGCIEDPKVSVEVKLDWVLLTVDAVGIIVYPALFAYHKRAYNASAAGNPDQRDVLRIVATPIVALILHLALSLALFSKDYNQMKTQQIHQQSDFVQVLIVLWTAFNWINANLSFSCIVLFAGCIKFATCREIVKNNHLRIMVMYMLVIDSAGVILDAYTKYRQLDSSRSNMIPYDFVLVVLDFAGLVFYDQLIGLIGDKDKKPSASSDSETQQLNPANSMHYSTIE